VALHLRLLLDHSLLEVFTGNGQALTTRVYRGATPHADPGCEDLGIDFLALGGDGALERMAAWEVRSCWREESAGGGLACLDGLTGKLDGLQLAPSALPAQDAAIFAL